MVNMLLKKVVVCVAMMGMFGSVQAGFIARTDFGPQAVTYDFTGASIGDTTPGDGFLTLSDGEVVAASPAPGSTAPAYDNRGSVNPPSGGVIRFDFNGFVSAVGFTAYYNNAPVLFELFGSADNLLDSILISPTDCGGICGFIGLDVGTSSVSYALASVPSRDSIHNLYVDDIIYQGITTVPGPSTLALFGMMFALVGFARRRAQR